MQCDWTHFCTNALYTHLCHLPPTLRHVHALTQLCERCIKQNTERERNWIKVEKKTRLTVVQPSEVTTTVFEKLNGRTRLLDANMLCPIGSKIASYFGLAADCFYSATKTIWLIWTSLLSSSVFFCCASRQQDAEIFEYEYLQLTFTSCLTVCCFTHKYPTFCTSALLLAIASFLPLI